MREIKFRAWDKDSQEMLEPNRFPMTAYIQSHNNNGSNPIVLMQYTGLKDKNGREIYEGDVVEVVVDQELTGKKTFLGCVEVDELYGNLVDFPQYGCGLAFGSPALCHPIDWEVIGTIHENPDLLE